MDGYRRAQKRSDLSARALGVALALVVAGCAGPGASVSGGPGANESASVRPGSHDPGAIVAAGDEASVSYARMRFSGPDAAEGATRMNAFAFSLFHALPDGNLVYSPASIALALGMARAGARGETGLEMDGVMTEFASPANLAGLASLDQALAAISGSYPDLTGRMQPVALRIANTSFAQRGMGLSREYLTTLASAYGAGVRLADYAADPEAARLAINGWVAKQTENRIKELVPAGCIDSSTRLTLVNAIYLKAPWLHQFSDRSTESADFHLLDGTTVKVPMMSDRQPVRYATGAGWRAVELPYVGERLAMTIIVPDDIAAFGATLDAAEFESIVSSLAGREVNVGLPRFKLQTQANLSDTLVAMGMPAAFDPTAADFSGITTDEQLFISAVIHQANIDVDENGTEAAAATAVAMAGSAAPAEPLTFRADRPFVFALRDRQTGGVIFLGRVLDPSKG